MPHVLVKTWKGKSEAQKKELTEKITQAVKESLGAGDYWISVGIEDVEPADWKEVYKKEIEPLGDNLYKKPGYQENDLP
jgi:4-oxalocrotonate tautomerase